MPSPASEAERAGAQFALEVLDALAARLDAGETLDPADVAEALRFLELVDPAAADAVRETPLCDRGQALRWAASTMRRRLAEPAE